MLPIVTLIGHPNVGKSSLFNRLTQSRDALIYAQSGMTRDRQYGLATCMHRTFILIDTGGIATGGDEITKLVHQQSMQAIEDANTIIFLTDAKAGLTPDDYLIADLLRRSGKPIFLAVNKTEGMDEAELTDFTLLGMGLIYPISAAHGTGITQLITAILPEKTPNIKTDQPSNIDSSEPMPPSIKLALVGRPNAGKSTLINRMLGKERVIVHNQPGTTRDSIFIPMERFGQAYILIDTAGIRRRKNVIDVSEKFSIGKTLQAIESANVVLYMIDAKSGVHDQDLKMLGFVLNCGKALVLAINKWDGLSEEERHTVHISIDRQLEFVSFARVHFISALHGTGVGNLFDSVNEAYTSATKKLATPEVTRLLQKATHTHPPPLVQGRRIKLRYAHAGGYNPPKIIIHGNQLQALPGSYKRYLAHFFQKALKLYGTPIEIVFKTSKNPFKD